MNAKALCIVGRHNLNPHPIASAFTINPQDNTTAIGFYFNFFKRKMFLHRQTRWTKFKVYIERFFSCSATRSENIPLCNVMPLLYHAWSGISSDILRFKKKCIRCLRLSHCPSNKSTFDSCGDQIGDVVKPLSFNVLVSFFSVWPT